jgi:hypothetical protein
MVFAHGTSAVWRFPVAFHSFWALITIALFWGLPETPRYFYATGDVSRADAILSQVYGGSINEAHVKHAKAEILASLELERQDSAALKVTDFFWDTSSLQTARRIRTGVLLVAIAYLMGINVIFYYTTTIFQVYIGLSPLTASGLAGAANTVLAITNLIGVYFLEKFGRRKWLITGAIGQTIFMAVFIGMLANPGQKTGAAAAAMLFLWIFFFAPTWGPVTVGANTNSLLQAADRVSTCMLRRSCRSATATLASRSVCPRNGLWHSLPYSQVQLRSQIRMLAGKAGFGFSSSTSLRHHLVGIAAEPCPKP